MAEISVIIMPVSSTVKKTEITHHFWRQELADVLSSLKIAHGAAFPATEPAISETSIYLHPWATDKYASDILGKLRRRAHRLIPLYQGYYVGGLVLTLRLAVKLQHKAFRHFAFIIVDGSGW